jgi:5-formyltetrahydrofolate cyclo-ligase
LIENAWGIREPAGDEPIDAAEIDMVLVPLLCFDKRSHRVGYGKGYYDRFLSKCRPDCLKIGLSFFPPVEAILRIGSRDIALDHFVLPDSTYTINGRKDLNKSPR